MPRSCGASITKLERIQAGTPVYVSPATLQGYRSEADLERHARELQRQLGMVMAGAHPLLQQLQAQAMRGGGGGGSGQGPGPGQQQQGPGHHQQQQHFRGPAGPAAAHAQMQAMQQQAMMAAFMQQQAAMAAAAQQGQLPAGAQQMRMMPGPVPLHPGQQQQQQQQQHF